MLSSYGRTRTDHAWKGKTYTVKRLTINSRVQENQTRTPMKRINDRANVAYRITPKYVLCFFCNATSSAVGSLLGIPVMLSMAMANPALVSIQMDTRRVRKVLFWSSVVGFSGISFLTTFVIARVTVSLNAASTSACSGVWSSTTACSAPLDFVEETEGRGSALSEPLVPQDTCEWSTNGACFRKKDRLHRVDYKTHRHSEHWWNLGQGKGTEGSSRTYAMDRPL